MKQRQMATMTCRGEWKVIYLYGAKQDPFKVTVTFYNGGYKRTMTMARYSDLSSAMAYLFQIAVDTEQNNRLYWKPEVTA